MHLESSVKVKLKSNDIFLDLTDFVMSLEATFDRKVSKLRRSVKDAFSNQHWNENIEKTYNDKF